MGARVAVLGVGPTGLELTGEIDTRCSEASKHVDSSLLAHGCSKLSAVGRAERAADRDQCGELRGAELVEEVCL